MQELFVLRGEVKKRGITTTAILLFTQCHIYPEGVMVRNYINLNGGAIFHPPNVFTGYYFCSFFHLRVALLKRAHHFSEHFRVKKRKNKPRTFPSSTKRRKSRGTAATAVGYESSANDQADAARCRSAPLAAGDGAV